MTKLVKALNQFAYEFHIKFSANVPVLAAVVVNV